MNERCSRYLELWCLARLGLTSILQEEERVGLLNRLSTDEMNWVSRRVGSLLETTYAVHTKEEGQWG